MHKFDRRGYKRRDRILMLSKTTLYLVEEEGKMKHQLPMDALVRLEITSQSDQFILLRLDPKHQKSDKGDLILEMPNVIEFVTFIVSVTKNHELIHINTMESGT